MFRELVNLQMDLVNNLPVVSFMLYHCDPSE